jgi:hypothetical protein
VFEADGCQPSDHNETPIAVQRKRSACVGINDDRDDLADTRGRTSSQQGIGDRTETASPFLAVGWRRQQATG